MVHKSVKHVGGKVARAKNLRNMSFFHPGEKVFFNVRTKVKGYIVEDHGLSAGFYLLLFGTIF
jgi:hypothetical protein